MSTMSAGRTAHGSGAARFGAARAVRFVTMLVVGLIVVGIVLVLLEASRSNGLVEALLECGADPGIPDDDHGATPELRRVRCRHERHPPWRTGSTSGDVSGVRGQPQSGTAAAFRTGGSC